MTEPTGPPEPPVLKRDGFEICESRFSAGGVQRVEGSRLKELFDPQSLTLKRDQKAAIQSAKSLFKRSFFAAQLRYYGFTISKSAKLRDLYEMLRDAAFEGKCNKVPESVLRLEQTMRADYEPAHKEWEDQVHTFNTEKEKRDDEIFAQCKTPGERAAMDIDRFLDHYFLTDGKPDPKKTPEPLALHGLENGWKLHSATNRIQGLYTQSAGYDFENRTLCIGWDQPAVLAKVREVTHQIRAEKDKQRQAENEKEIQAHEDYLKSAAESAPSRGENNKGARKNSLKAFDLQRCQGSFLVHCGPVTSNWDVEGSMTLDICKHEEGGNAMLMADYNFGIIEGTMLLSQSEQVLDEVAGRDEDSIGAETDEFSDGGDDDDDEEEGPGSSKRKRSLDKAAAANEKARRSSEASQPAKKAKMTPSLSRRVYYRMRGRETGEGEIFPGPAAGHLDFLDEDCTKFVGLAYDFPHLDQNVEFKGYKVSDRPKRRPSDWESFRGDAYEDEGVLGWW